MRLTIDVEIECQLSAGDAALLMVEAAAVDGQSLATASLEVDGAELNRPVAAGPAVWATVPGEKFKLCYHAAVDITRGDISLGTLAATPHEDLPGDVLPFLRPSRFCQSDLFTDFAQQQFGALQGGTKIAAIRDWISAELSYVPGSSHSATSAVETFADRQGVCRDFAHLLCALARATQIPARYVSVYGAHVDPQDFHAVAQIWLDGAWHLVDATGMGGPDSFAIIASGRDAADVAFMETAHWADMIWQRVTVTKS